MPGSDMRPGIDRHERLAGGEKTGAGYKPAADRRLDHIWATPALAETARSIDVLVEARGWTRPSDHVPVTGVFAIE